MNTPMTLKDLKPGMIVRYRLVDDTKIDLRASDIDHKSGQISGCIRFTSQWETIQVRPTDELEVYSRGGARLYPGITKAEIEAWEVHARATAAGLEPVVEITHKDGRVQAYIKIPGKTMWDESLHATWYTVTKGRRTTKYAYGFEIRGACRSKKYKRAVSVKLSKQQFFRELGHVCFLGEYKGIGQ